MMALLDRRRAMLASRYGTQYYNNGALGYHAIPPNVQRRCLRLPALQPTDQIDSSTRLREGRQERQVTVGLNESLNAAPRRHCFSLTRTTSWTKTAFPDSLAPLLGW